MKKPDILGQRYALSEQEEKKMLGEKRMESSLREDLLLKTVSLLELHKAQGMMP